MTTPTSNLGLLKGVGSDNWRTYLKTSLASSLDVLDTAIPKLFFARAYGATGSGSGDDGPAINSAIAAAQAAGNATVVLGPGHFRFTTQITISGANKGIAFVGMPVPMTTQQGSTVPACVLEWAGGATPAISVTVTKVTPIMGFSIYNTGTGTAAFAFNPNDTFDLNHVSFASPSGSTPWSTAAILSTAGINYSRIADCIVEVAPFLKHTGLMTTLEIRNCLFDANGSPSPFLDFNGLTTGGDLITIHNCTCNSQNPPATFFDNSSSAAVLSNLVIRECEFDGNALAVQSYIAKVKNVRNFVFENNVVSGMGSASVTQSPIQLTAVDRTRIEHTDLDGCNKPLVKCNDANCRVYVGPNRINLSNTLGILDASGAVPGNIVAVTANSPSSGAAHIKGDLTNPQSPTVFVVTASTNTAFQLQISVPTDSDKGRMEPGTVFWIVVKNTSGGAMGAVTFDTIFKTSGSFTTPANGNSRAICFYYDGTNAFEVHRSSADVAN